MTNPLIVLIAALLATMAGPAGADDLAAVAQGMCEKVKSCAMEQIAEQEMTPEMREMMVPMLDNMCATMRSEVQDVPAGHPLYAPAVACLRSMENLTCEQMRNADGMVTPECTEYERLAKQFEGDQPGE